MVVYKGVSKCPLFNSVRMTKALMPTKKHEEKDKFQECVKERKIEKDRRRRIKLQLLEKLNDSRLMDEDITGLPEIRHDDVYASQEY